MRSEFGDQPGPGVNTEPSEMAALGTHCRLRQLDRTLKLRVVGSDIRKRISTFPFIVKLGVLYLSGPCGNRPRFLTKPYHHQAESAWLSCHLLYLGRFEYSSVIGIYK